MYIVDYFVQQIPVYLVFLNHSNDLFHHFSRYDEELATKDQKCA